MGNESQFNRAVCLATLTAVILSGSGCASIVHGGPRVLTVASVPAGAKTTISKADSGEAISINTTPFTVSLKPKRGFFKGQSYTLKLELPGYATSEVQVRAKLSGWYWGNIIFGGVIGLFIVDPATGSMWNLSPDKIEQTLTPAQAQLIKSGQGFVVVLASDLTANEKAAMVRIQ